MSDTAHEAVPQPYPGWRVWQSQGDTRRGTPGSWYATRTSGDLTNEDNELGLAATVAGDRFEDLKGQIDRQVELEASAGRAADVTTSPL